MSKPASQALYDKVKQDIYDKYTKYSAYRSGLLVKTYKERGGTYIGKSVIRAKSLVQGNVVEFTRSSRLQVQTRCVIKIHKLHSRNRRTRK